MTTYDFCVLPKNSPINITENVQGSCDLKCNFSFNYPYSSTISVERKDDHLLFKLDEQHVSPVTYNSEHYNVRGSTPIQTIATYVRRRAGTRRTDYRT